MKTKNLNNMIEELRAYPERISTETIEQLTAETKAAAKRSKDAETAYFADAEDRKASIQGRITTARERASEIDKQIAELNQKIKDAAINGNDEEFEKIGSEIDALVAEKSKILKSAERLEGIDPGGDGNLYHSVIDAVDAFLKTRQESYAALHQLADIADSRAEELVKIAKIARNMAGGGHYGQADKSKVRNHYDAELIQKAQEAAAIEKAQPKRMVTSLTTPDRPQQRNIEDAVCTSRQVTTFGKKQSNEEQQVTVITPRDHVKREGDE